MNEEKQKLEKVIYTLKEIKTKISNLKLNFNSSSKTLGENLIVNDKTYENQRINNINSNLDSAVSTIRTSSRFHTLRSRSQLRRKRLPLISEASAAESAV